ncbi:O-methylsterigmatocystin oxidoreductase Short=OMST oxidoreductase [Rhizoctonia solani AG-1 IB]|uniref:O-methylsterigmatocystin oxidoreductase Short=OMST oxidoreductase n=1 Tax=Thanatephorus cucumeris (strain AG1-IB / isolate 7/3/14) TaxID=1108050 RepID=M5C8V9_THACB|nr:O-methylsterigmatocystin oxidoreductase Short=OMST oxidoreductase [Rhizoctonia solani AG-1 IB]
MEDHADPLGPGPALGPTTQDSVNRELYHNWSTLFNDLAELIDSCKNVTRLSWHVHWTMVHAFYRHTSFEGTPSPAIKRISTFPPFMTSLSISLESQLGTESFTRALSGMPITDLALVLYDHALLSATEFEKLCMAFRGLRRLKLKLRAPSITVGGGLPGQFSADIEPISRGLSSLPYLNSYRGPLMIKRPPPIPSVASSKLIRLETKATLSQLACIKEELFYTMAVSMFEMAFGYQIQGKNDPFLRETEQAFHNGFRAAMFANFYVNIFPALMYVPEWFPGAGWKRTLRKWKAEKIRAMSGPYEWVKARLASILLSASATALLNFVAAMALYPRVQEKAQRELDMVLGSGVMPTIGDRDRLPYINNIVLEVLRWPPVLPTAIPHVCYEDDVYRGYSFVKGDIIFGNVWAMSRDKSIYTNPDDFDPDRFLDPNVPPLPGFGWGRRKCPGSHYGESSIFIVLSSILAVYNISKQKDSSGREVQPEIKDAPNSLTLELEPFDFAFEPRSNRHRQLILEAV